MARRRLLSAAAIAEALAAAGECRACCIQVLTEAPINGDAYRAAQRVLAAIDDLAEALVGDRTHFHPKPHGANFQGHTG